MKKYRIDIDKNGNFQSAKHYLDVNEQVDERVLERARTLMIQGLTPGPLLYRDHADVVFLIFASMVIANVLTLAAALVFIGGGKRHVEKIYNQNV